MRNLVRACFLAASFAFAAAPALSSPLNGQTINGVSINDTVYNVTFFDTALSQVPNSFQFTFDTFVHASQAITAIITSSEFYVLIQSANTTAGTYYMGIIVPFGMVLPATTRPAEYQGAVYHAKDGTIESLPLFYGPSSNPNTTGDYTFVGYPVTAVATPGQTMAGVPEPSTIALVAFGLFGVGVARRRV